MFLRKAALITIALSVQSGLAWADGHESPFSGSVELGYSEHTGNRESESTNVGATLTHFPEGSSNKFELYLKSSEEGEGGDLYVDYTEYGLRNNYYLNDDSSVYVRLTHKEDPFRGIKTEDLLAVGYKRDFIDRDGYHFSTRIGLATKDSEYTPKADSGREGKAEGVVLGLNGAMPIMENISLEGEFFMYSNIDDSQDYLQNISVKLVFEVNEHMEINFGYNSAYDNFPLNGVDGNDRSFQTSIVYNF